MINGNDAYRVERERVWKRSVAVGYRSKQKDENRQELSRKAQKLGIS